MNEWTDQQLLRDYADHRSEGAFAELVRRHIDLVYSAALRMVCDADLAKDVSQNTFLALAQSAPRLVDRPVLSGWLHRTAQNLAAKVVRSNVRRRAREQEAAAMNELLSVEPEAVWEHIAPHLDAALGELDESDRDAVLLRYFERKSAREMAQTFGISDVAAQKRVSRAVERLREFFAKRGVTVGASGLVVVIFANAVQAAPLGLAVTVSTAAALTGTTFATTATVTATKVIAMTTLQKTIITATVTVLAGAGIYEARQASQLREQTQTLQQQQAPLSEQVRQLERERDETVRQLAALRDENERLNRNTDELLRLRGEVGTLRRQLVERSKSAAQFSPAVQPNDPVLQTKQMGREKTLDGRNYAVQFNMFAEENKGWLPTNWQQVAKYQKDFAGSGTNEFEMVHQSPLNRNQLGTNVERTALVREYLAWPTPDGRWGRIYGFADGHSQVVFLKDGDFDTWEQQNTFIPQPASK